jgi:hypothetical protein
VRAPLALVAFAAATASGAAQTVVPAGAVSLVQTRIRNDFGSGSEQFVGPLVGAQGVVAVWRVQLAINYAQGRVDPDGASEPGHDVVEASVLLGVKPLPWLTLEGGPHARSYALIGGTQRWLFWELRVRAEGAFIGSAGKGYVEVWRPVAASINVPEPFDHAQGAEAGMIIRLSRAPLELRLGYQIEHAVLGGGARLETVDGVVLAATLARR